MTPNVAPTLVIVGVTGDLAKRKLLPALRALSARNQLPFGRIIGTSRRPLVLDTLLEAGDPLRSVFEVVSLPNEDSAYRTLAEHVSRVGGETFFYLAVPPGSAGVLAAQLAAAGCTGTLVLEKPFGMDAISAQREAANIAAAFGTKIVRVDHYIAKPLTERLVNAQPGRNAARIEVAASELLGLEGRVDFYDTTGALRDTGNHLLSLLCASLGAKSADDRLRELQQLSVVKAERAQYEGYTAEVGHSTDTETFIYVELVHRAHPQLSIVCMSGKALDRKQTIVRIVTNGIESQFAEEPGDSDAHERLFCALAQGDHRLFLSEAEALESWQLLDAARSLWGSVARYAPGTVPRVG